MPPDADTSNKPPPPRLFDRVLLDRRRARSAAQGPALFLMERAAEDLGDRVALHKRHFDTALEIGGFASPLAAHLPADKIGRLWRCDTLGTSGEVDFIASPEALPLATGAFDLCLSCLYLQFTNDLPGAFLRIRESLRPDGLFLAALIGGDSLTELRQAFGEAEIELMGGMSPRVVPMADVRGLGGLLQRAGFALPVADLDRVTVTYETPLGLLRDLRAMGATNPLVERHKRPLRRDLLMRAMAIYAERFGTGGGRVAATFDILHLSAWAPAPTQPQPLKPGSAKMRLADALEPRRRD